MHAHARTATLISICPDVQLFEDGASNSAMNDSDALTLLSDTYPGFLEDRPIAITYESGTKNGED